MYRITNYQFSFYFTSREKQYKLQSLNASFVIIARSLEIFIRYTLTSKYCNRLFRRDFFLPKKDDIYALTIFHSNHGQYTSLKYIFHVVITSISIIYLVNKLNHTITIERNVYPEFCFDQQFHRQNKFKILLNNVNNVFNVAKQSFQNVNYNFLKDEFIITIPCKETVYRAPCIFNLI